MLLAMEHLNFICLDSQVVSIEQQLAIEESLLRTDNGNWCLVKRGSCPTVVMGISGKADELVHMHALESANIPLLKRYSGGGTVVVDEETLFVSFIGNHSLLPCKPFPRAIMKWTEGVYSSFLSPYGFRLLDNDYVIGHRKIGGNAQSLTKRRFVHHTTFLWKINAELMGLLKVPKRQPAYRKGREHESFLTDLSIVLPYPEWLFDQLYEVLSDRYSVRRGDLPDISNLLLRPHRRATVKLS